MHLVGLIHRPVVRPVQATARFGISTQTQPNDSDVQQRILSRFIRDLSPERPQAGRSRLAQVLAKKQAPVHTSKPEETFLFYRPEELESMGISVSQLQAMEAKGWIHMSSKSFSTGLKYEIVVTHSGLRAHYGKDNN